MKKAFAWRDLTILASLAAATGFSSVPTVPKLVKIKTSLGPVTGFNAGTTTSSGTASCDTFYGIPYAAPPTDANRFRPPQPGVPWTEPRPVILREEETVLCPQNNYDNPLINVEEDCLFLNVFTPHDAPSDGSPLAVVVFIHGGDFHEGSGLYDIPGKLAPINGGSHLCADGGVVVVTLNYRLGVLGFLATDELLVEQGTAGNMGIQDQRKALEWVQENAAAFGGDPTRVTIVGQSAGAQSVVYHLTMNRSAPLFSAAILMSPAVPVRAFEPASAYGNAFANAAGCSSRGGASVLACLRGLRMEKLLRVQINTSEIGKAMDNFTFSEGFTPSQPWGAASDGFEYPLGESVHSILQSGRFVSKPVLIGGPATDFGAPPYCGQSLDIHNEDSFREDFNKTKFGIDKNGELMNQTIDMFYDGDWSKAWRQLMSDVSFYCAERFILDAFFKIGQPSVFHYVMTLPFVALDKEPRSLQPLGCTGPGHGDDEVLLMGDAYDMVNRTSTETALGYRMRLYWANFAKNHTPDAAWPAYGGPEEGFYYNLNASDSKAMQWQQAQCDFLHANDLVTWKAMPCAEAEDGIVDVPFWKPC